MILCFDIGGSAIKPAYATSPEDIVVLPTFKTPLHDYTAFIASLAAFVGKAQAISISVTGVVDPETGVLKCANIECIDGKHFTRDLAAATSLPVRISNDADCFALVEATLGAARGHRNVFAIILGSGVGGALVIDGHIVGSAGGFVGEWGHGPILATKINTPPYAIPHFDCSCGQSGCVNTVGGARGLEMLHHFLNDQSRTSLEIVDEWQRGNAAATHTIAAYVELVSAPLAFAINITGASIVPVGGGLSAVPELIALLDKTVRQKILRKTAAPILVKANYKHEPGLIGAALLGFQEFKNA